MQVMKHEELVEFITNKMSMQHIYQPLLIKTLVECGGSATVRQIAQAVLSNDESQLHYYEQRIKQMPVEVLKNHGVLERDGELVSLNLKKMSLKEKSELLMLCEQKMRGFVQDNDDIWESRITTKEVGELRYEVLKRANKRCALCGVKDGDEEYEDRLPLHIDHIVPRSKGGSNEIEILQVLCRACNLGKSNRDDTDFR
jgi:predicted restriction endonuclease